MGQILLKGFTATVIAGMLAVPMVLPATLHASDISRGVRHCRDLLSSPTFRVHEKGGNGAAARVTNALVGKVMDILQTISDRDPDQDKDAMRTFMENRVDFDLLEETISHHVEKGEWVVDEASDKILDECYSLLHSI